VVQYTSSRYTRSAQSMSIFKFTGSGDKCDHIPSRFTKRTGYVKILLLGPPCSGKTSLFNLLTSNEQSNRNDSALFSTADVSMRVCYPIDARLEWMNTNFRCTDKMPLKVNVIDTPSIVPGSVRVSICDYH